MSQCKTVNISRDAQRVFDVLRNGGLAIIPANVGYGLVACDAEALDRLVTVKRRKPHKKHAMIGSYVLQEAIHVLPPERQAMVRLLTVDLDLPLGVVAPFRSEQPLVCKLGIATLSQSTVEETLSMLVNGGRLQEELSRLTTAAGLPLMGSSANISGTGTKLAVDEIEADVQAAADIVIDYGRQRYGHPRASSTMIDFASMRVVRFGAPGPRYSAIGPFCCLKLDCISG
ncbi:DHBP synthase RibB-like alpha/beta domain-containing protein [Aspergillus taichungensis]|uniref:Threonylcarbamoyl-AMP synthase n=1 Tax=Aspergillus taichungensis TaxID=482145 RepID=A0A2J5HRW8_9EURO|nr:DHBP synthase RibB-like alpha/beta domain-containing protein [Aspergillus taichungensis]